ncbi:hypothetical protein EDM59_23625 [Brevibacillus nitrificans]|uniref:Uncharacterized protein n=1 Tax=Brevibacillus nitrificans TaxID=651560 RepID=A0A3M8CXC6_9BACL|nr:hypothetical protein EDM59_23625 [Brevibacillus nitrificans]
MKLWVLWVLLILVIGGLLLFGGAYEFFSRRKRKVPLTPDTYDQTYAEQLLLGHAGFHKQDGQLSMPVDKKTEPAPMRTWLCFPYLFFFSLLCY